MEEPAHRAIVHGRQTAETRRTNDTVSLSSSPLGTEVRVVVGIIQALTSAPLDCS